MTKTMHAIAIAVLMAAATPPAQAQDEGYDPAVVAAARAWQDATATRLARAGDARSLAFAATLRQAARATGADDGGAAGDDTPSTEVVADPEAARWREQALAKAGSDPQALAMLMATGPDGSTAVRTRAAIAWAQREPRNLAPLLFRGDEIDVLLADASRVEVFDLHFLDQVRFMRDATVRNPPAETTLRLMTGDETPAEEFAAMQAVAFWGASGMPGFAPLMEACSGRALRDTERLATCTRIADVLATRSDTAIGTMVGLSLKAQVAQDDASRQAVADARRTFDWQMQEWGRVSAGLPRNGGAQFTALLRDPAVADENAVRVRILTLAGVPLAPPDGWQSAAAAVIRAPVDHPKHESASTIARAHVVQRITLHYDRPLIRQAVSRFWWRVVGIRFVVAFALLAIGLAMLIRDGDTSWMTGALASILVFGLLFVIAIYLVHYRDGLARLEGMGSPQATLEMTKKSLTLSSGAGSSTLPWSSIEEIWQFEPCWLLLFSRSHFVTLPRADLTPETQAYLLDRVRTSRANAS